MRTAGGAVRSGGNKIESVVMPCDAVIIRGGCMVNEAMLTGESTPQVKEGISELILEIDCKDDLTGRPVRGDRIEVDLEGGVSAEGAFRVLPYDDHDCSRSSSELKAISGDVSTRRHRLFAGTTVIQHSYGVALPSSSMSTAINSTSNSSPTINSTNNSSSTTSSKVSIPDSPDRGCIAVVTKTGFGTTQGELMRKILYASERVNVDSSETYVFIALLVCFAIIASVVVLKRGLADPDRNTFKVILHCIMIVTSVVPPELPMELSLAVTHSVVALSKMLVYCTEPFRISYAGRLNVLCFDKTGTLTQDKMQYRGIISSDVIDELAILEGKDVDVHRCCVVKAELMLDDAGGEKFSEMSGRDASPHKFVEINSSMVPSLCLAAMASCHSLVYDPRNSKLTGDPLELAAFESSKYLLSRDCMDAIALKSAPRAGTVVYADEVNTASSDYRKVEALVENIRILHKYPFSSALKMMSVLCRVNYHQSVLDDIDHGALVTSTAANDSTTATTATPRLSRSSEKYVVFTKGAPEVIATKLKQVPEFYRGTYLYHMGRGKRLLALACKILPIGTSSAGASASAMKAPWRDEVERDLVFLGFIAFDSDLKADSKSVVRALKNAGSKVVVITGDSAFTAADVAKKLRISSRVASDKESKGGSISGGSNRKGSGKSTTGADGGGSVAKEVPAPLSSVLLLIPTASNSGVRDGSGSHVEAMDASSSSLTATLPRLVWRVASLGDSSDALSDDTPLDVTSSVLADLSAKFTLCVTGPAMSVLSVLYPGTEVGTRDFHDTLKHLCPFITIFARVSPTQKEQIVQALNASGLYTLMCGDGTNDVGALRAAHVGISIVNNPELETLVESKSSGGRSGTRTSKSTGSSSATVGQDRLARALAEQELQELDPTLVKLGDASIASPFTSRRTSIDAVLSVMRQGRCTLVTMLQIFKVLALNCLCSAYFMSALYLRGLKQGDYQMTAAGLLTAGLFFFLSQAKPMPTLAPYAPPASVFSASVLYSIIGQFIVHIATVLLTVYMCDYFDMTTAGDDSVLQLDSVAAVSGGGGAYTASVLARQVHRRISIPDSAFHPNLLNSAMYIIGVLIQTNNFVVNYRGEPFTQSLVDNKPLLRSVQLIYLVLFIALTEVFTPLNDLLQLITFPNLNFKYALGGVCLANFALCFCIERMCRSLEQKALN
jgi:cation-transporting ATPase 13A1